MSHYLHGNDTVAHGIMNDTIEEVAVKNDSVIIGPLVELEGPKDSNDLGEVSLLHHNSILSRISTGRHRVVGRRAFAGRFGRDICYGMLH